MKAYRSGHSPVSLATSKDSARETFIALSQVVMATETQQSPMLQAEASQEGTQEAFSLFDASVHVQHVPVHFAIAGNTDNLTRCAAAAGQQATDRRAPLASSKTYSTHLTPSQVLLHAAVWTHMLCILCSVQCSSLTVSMCSWRPGQQQSGWC